MIVGDGALSARGCAMGEVRHVARVARSVVVFQMARVTPLVAVVSSAGAMVLVAEFFVARVPDGG